MTSKHATRPWKLTAHTCWPSIDGVPVTSFRRSISDTPRGYDTVASHRSAPLLSATAPSLPPAKPSTTLSPAKTIGRLLRRFSADGERW